MKIYTKTGDTGETGLLGGIRVSKAHLAIETCGELDETNSLLGVVVSQSPPAEIRSLLKQIQNDLFDLGSRVAACESETSQAAEFSMARATQLETWIDQFQTKLSPLKEFILPGGSLAAAMLHLARSVCRRCERRLVALNNAGKNRELSIELVYLNRLSDLLFVLARYSNQQAGIAETVWAVTRS